MYKNTKETVSLSPQSEAINRMLNGEFPGESLPNVIQYIETERKRNGSKRPTINEILQNLRLKNQV